MKPTSVLDMNRQGDLGGQKIDMKFDANSIAHIMSVLTDLYSDHELAIIREYSTNARDAHIAAGQTRPIEVTTPNSMSPYFKVKDYGIGLSVDDIENIYSQYGASTKRGTDAQTGMLGLGCKSALTYTNQFMLTAVKNGVKTIVNVGRKEDGTGVMEVVDTVSTTEPNGVEVTIPAKRGNALFEKAKTFFQFWDEGTVILNGMPVKKVTGNQITPNMVTIVDHNLSSDVIVMGGVAYPVPGGLYAGHRPYQNRYKIVAFVNIGEVNFVPSREALAMNSPLTNSTIERLRHEYVTALWTTVQNDVDAAADHPEALARHIKWEQALGQAPQSHAITYKGATIPRDWAGEFTTWNPNRSRYSVSQGNYRIDHNTVQNSVIVTGYDKHQKLTQTHKEKMRKWASDNGLTPRSFVLCVGGHPGLPWVNGTGVVSWSDIKALRLNTGPRAARVVRYDVFDPTLGYFTAQDVPAGSEFLYIGSRERYTTSQWKSLLALFPTATIVQMGENRWAKFERENKGALHIRKAIQASLDKVTAALTDADKQRISMDYYDKRTLEALDESRLDDPLLVEAVQIAKGLTTGQNVLDYNKTVQVANTFAVHVPSIPTKSALGNYPLMQGNTGHLDHIYIYANAVYAANQNGAI